MNAAKIVVHIVNGDRDDVIFDFLKEPVRALGESAH
jgi:hypothetical protein